MNTGPKTFKHMNNGERMVFLSKNEGQNVLRQITKGLNREAKRKLLDMLTMEKTPSRSGMTVLWFAAHQAVAFGNTSMWQTIEEIFKDVMTSQEMIDAAPKSYFSFLEMASIAAAKKQFPDILNRFKTCLQDELNDKIKGIHFNGGDPLALAFDLTVRVPAPIVRARDLQNANQVNADAAPVLTLETLATLATLATDVKKRRVAPE